MGREYGESLVYYPTLTFQCLDVRLEVITIFFRGARSKPVSPFTGDIKYITFTLSEEDGIISHDLCNLVLDSPE